MGARGYLLRGLERPGMPPAPRAGFTIKRQTGQRVAAGGNARGSEAMAVRLLPMKACGSLANGAFC